MRLQSLRIRNYRSVATEQTIEIPNGLTLVGPNNSGKTNVLKAIALLFTGFENTMGYSRDADMTFGRNSEQTTLVATFACDGSPGDGQLMDLYNQLNELYQPPRPRSVTEIQVQLIFSSTGNPSYRLSSDTTTKLPRESQSTHSRLIRKLIDELTSSYAVHYVPSAKSGEDIFSDVISPLMKQSVASQLRAEILALKGALSDISSQLNTHLAASGLANFGVDFEVPDPESGEFLSYFHFRVSDPESTSIFDKGRGIQSLAMFACFAWIAQQERKAGMNSLWLIEEPESYLHPQLYDNANALLRAVGESAQVVRTTHALGLVPGDAQLVLGTGIDESGRTSVQKFPTPTEATRSLRNSLGVRFSDYFGLSEYNIFTEGESDIRLIEWALSLIAADYPLVEAASKRSFGGTVGLRSFLMSNYEHIRPERSAVSIFDGDEAGRRAVRDVTSYLNNHGSGFVSNRDYVSLPRDRAIEGLFPDEYIIAAYNREPKWFDNWHVDTDGGIVDFHVRDQSKRAVEGFLTELAESGEAIDWTPRWLSLLNALESALHDQHERVLRG